MHDNNFLYRCTLLWGNFEHDDAYKYVHPKPGLLIALHPHNIALRLVQYRGVRNEAKWRTTFRNPKDFTEISRFPDFKWDFKISSGISRFHARFQDFK